MKNRVFTLSIICCLLFTNCKNGEVNNKYCNLPARLHIENVLQAPTVLMPACESMGEFCTVKISDDGQRFQFTNAEGKTDLINILAISGYNGYILGLNSGLIIGKPSIPELGESTPRVICLDRDCSNCYLNYHITKPLVLQTAGYAKCNSCGRTYNLNDCGTISDGPAGRNLFRYRVNYLNYTLYINNG